MIKILETAAAGKRQQQIKTENYSVEKSIKRF